MPKSTGKKGPDIKRILLGGHGGIGSGKHSGGGKKKKPRKKGKKKR